LGLWCGEGRIRVGRIEVGVGKDARLEVSVLPFEKVQKVMLREASYQLKTKNTSGIIISSVNHEY